MNKQGSHRVAAENALANAERHQALANDADGVYDPGYHQNLLLVALTHAVLSLGEDQTACRTAGRWSE